LIAIDLLHPDSQKYIFFDFNHSVINIEKTSWQCNILLASFLKKWKRPPKCKENLQGVKRKEVSMGLDRIAVEIGGMAVKNLEGNDIPLASLWAERRVVLAFLRHFG
jgi:hypothetical protein